MLTQVVKGKINKEIAEELHISIYTVMTHRKNICQKAGFKSVFGLTVYASLYNLITQSDIE